MKKLLFTLGILFCIYGLNAQNINEFYYDNGNIKEILSFKEDKLHGKCITFSIDGNKTGQASYKNGIKHGVWKIWADNGTLLYENTFLESTVFSMEFSNYTNDSIYSVVTQNFNDGTTRTAINLLYEDLSIVLKIN